MKHKVDLHEYPGLESLMRQVGANIKTDLPPDVGFALFVFHIGPDPGGMAYMSSANRSDMILAIKEWLEMMEGEKHV
jgi:hypothetical protein